MDAICGLFCHRFRCNFRLWGYFRLRSYNGNYRLFGLWRRNANGWEGFSDTWVRMETADIVYIYKS